MYELIQNKKYREVRELVQDMHEADIAEEVSGWEDVASAVILFRLLPKDLGAEVFAYLEADMQRKIVEGITDSELHSILEELFMDDTVNFLEEMPSSIVRRVLRVSDAQTRETINRFLSYPPDSAGSLMTPEFILTQEEWTVEEAIADLRRHIEDTAAYTQLYVVDGSRHLLGAVRLHVVLGAPEGTLIRDIMDDHALCARTGEDQTEVIELFKKYDRTVLPVTDTENRLVGVITIDDVVDVIEEEATEDIYKMAAMEPIEDSYMDASVLTLSRKRVLWLVIMMLSSTFTGMIIQGYEVALSSNLILTSFIPMLMGTSGNAGSQASVSIIRSLVLGEVEFRDAFRVLWKEIRVGLLVGLVVSVLNFFKVWAFESTALIALTVSIAMFCSIVAAKMVGCLLPLVAARCKLDPALMASPMITTIVDVVSLLTYFNIALLVIPGL